jgi:hypothetical protein
MESSTRRRKIMANKKFGWEACLLDGKIPIKTRFNVKKEFSFEGYTFLIGHSVGDEKQYSVIESSTGGRVSGLYRTIEEAKTEALLILRRKGLEKLKEALEEHLNTFGPLENLFPWNKEE